MSEAEYVMQQPAESDCRLPPARAKRPAADRLKTPARHPTEVRRLYRSGDSGSKPMRKPAKDKIREDRIHNEAVVDAYGSEEKAMSWYYYLENKIRFSFQAKCIVANVASPIKKGETVEVRRLAPDDACSTDILVLIRWQGRNMAVPLFQLAPVDPDESTAEAIGDWHYWVARGYLF
jgi:hypothetical protein